ncbi:hypothetical protein ACW73O_13440, partial [Faecalibacterium prausnitzii]
HSSCSPTHCLRRSERSDFDGKGVSACLYVMAHKQPRLHCGMVMIAPLFREKHHGAPAVRLDTDSNVSVCPMMHRRYLAGFLYQGTIRLCQPVKAYRFRYAFTERQIAHNGKRGKGTRSPHGLKDYPT